LFSRDRGAARFLGEKMTESVEAKEIVGGSSSKDHKHEFKVKIPYFLLI
jgi:hypothetical protein